MLPKPTQLLALDAHDDGSLAATFRDADDAALTLLLPAKRDGAGRAAGFGLPELQRHVPHRFTDKFTGDHHAYATREDTPLAWEDAARLLARLAPLLPDGSGPADVHRAMLRAAARHGAAAGASPPSDPSTEPSP